MGASDTASSWLQTLVQTSGVLITVMFAALSVIIGAGGSQVTVTLKAGAGTLVALSSFLFLGSIWVGMKALGRFALAENVNADPLQATAKWARQAQLLFGAGIVIIVVASIVLTILAILRV